MICLVASKLMILMIFSFGGLTKNVPLFTKMKSFVCSTFPVAAIVAQEYRIRLGNRSDSTFIAFIIAYRLTSGHCGTRECFNG